jgi:SAM-dependent methyltransferase
MYAETTTGHKSWLKRFSHSARFSVASNLVVLDAETSILDFGAGDGQLLTIVLPRVAYACAFEPSDWMYEQLVERHGAALADGRLTVVRDEAQLPRERFDVVFCLEVLEHLPEALQIRSLRLMGELLSGSGQLVVSVPIEIGISAVFKNAVRRFLGQSHEGSSLVNTLKALFHLPVERQMHGSHVLSHVGFSYCDLERLLQSEGFAIQARTFSPFPRLRGLCNSQVLYVLAKPETAPGRQARGGLLSPEAAQ